MNTATLEAEILKSTAAEPFNLIEKVQLPKADALALEVDHFIQVLLGRKELMTTAREATFALEMVETFISKLDFQAKDFV